MSKRKLVAKTDENRKKTININTIKFIF
jgi:hypothetical protein